MIKKTSIIFAALLVAACDDSSEKGVVAYDDTSEKEAVAEDSLNQSGGDYESTEFVIPECKKSQKSSVDGDILSPTKNKSDTVCFYNDFPFKDTICCFGEPGTFLQRDDNGDYMNVSTDYGVGQSKDTVKASVDPTMASKCIATIGENHYQAVKIGDQTWFSENAKGDGRCLNDDDENCNLFGTLMSYEKAKDVCSGDFRLPTITDVEGLLSSVGVEIESIYIKDVCGTTPNETHYYNAPLFFDSKDSSKDKPYHFAFLTDGGVYDKKFDGKNLEYSTEKSCFFLQSDENATYVNAFCYDSYQKYAVETPVAKDAELYVRCIMK